MQKTRTISKQPRATESPDKNLATIDIGIGIRKGYFFSLGV